MSKCPKNVEENKDNKIKLVIHSFKEINDENCKLPNIANIFNVDSFSKSRDLSSKISVMKGNSIDLKTIQHENNKNSVGKRIIELENKICNLEKNTECLFHKINSYELKLEILLKEKYDNDYKISNLPNIPLDLFKSSDFNNKIIILKEIKEEIHKNLNESELKIQKMKNYLDNEFQKQLQVFQKLKETFLKNKNNESVEIKTEYLKTEYQSEVIEDIIPLKNKYCNKGENNIKIINTKKDIGFNNSGVYKSTPETKIKSVKIIKKINL